MEKAYDTVPLQKLWEALEDMEINTIVIKAINNLYKNSISKIKIFIYLHRYIYEESHERKKCK